MESESSVPLSLELSSSKSSQIDWKVHVDHNRLAQYTEVLKSRRRVRDMGSFHSKAVYWSGGVPLATLGKLESQGQQFVKVIMKPSGGRIGSWEDGRPAGEWFIRAKVEKGGRDGCDGASANAGEVTTNEVAFTFAMGIEPTVVGNTVFLYCGTPTLDAKPEVALVTIVFDDVEAAEIARAKLSQFQIMTQRNLQDSPMSVEDGE